MYLNTGKKILNLSLIVIENINTAPSCFHPQKSGMPRQYRISKQLISDASESEVLISEQRNTKS